MSRLFDSKDHDILGEPDNLYRVTMRLYVEARLQEAGHVLFNELTAHFKERGWSDPTIVKHRDAIIRERGLEVAAVRPEPGQRGRPPKVAWPP